MSYKKRSNGWAAVVLVIVLVAVLLGVFSKGFKDWDYKNWFGKGEDKIEATDESGNKLDPDKVHPLPSFLVFRADTAEPGGSEEITLKATLTPVDADNQLLDWTVAWSTAGTWSADKTVTDYVTVTPTSDGALTAKVKCLQPFNEQITITVTSRGNPDAQPATCKVDYLRRLLGIGVTMTGETEEADRATLQFREEGQSYTLPYNWSVAYTMSQPEPIMAEEGSKDSGALSSAITVTWAEDFVEYMSQNGVTVNAISFDYSQRTVNLASYIALGRPAENGSVFDQYVKLYGGKLLSIHLAYPNPNPGEGGVIESQYWINAEKLVQSVAIDKPTLIV